MKKLRMWYEKTGRARYISHLDMNRCMQRAIRRAGVPAWHTQGFNPHVYLTFALPLSLGFESLCEILDFKTESDMSCEEMAARLNGSLPPDIRVLRIAPAGKDVSAIAAAVYTLRLRRDGVSGEALEERFAAFWGQGEIPAVKKTKKREITLNLKELVKVDGLQQEGEALCVTLTAPAGNDLTVNPALLVDAFWAFFPGEGSVALVTRTACLTAQGEDFA